MCIDDDILCLYLLNIDVQVLSICVFWCIKGFTVCKVRLINHCLI